MRGRKKMTDEAKKVALIARLEKRLAQLKSGVVEPEVEAPEAEVEA